MGGMMTLPTRRGQYSLVEQQVPAGAPVVGHAIKDLKLPENCVITAIIRRGDLVVPRGSTVFQAGDEVLALTDIEAAEQLALLLDEAQG
jgi:trk system potassium uptake protein TrkA